ncbi:hypothetical protein AVEN_20110-1 [Araneus ventricosus]|uniref:Uncharacterized protein n=1 Tax=Araneus ventricosus TaxID=182803 RepID=A0A4Y2MAP4_ARAVE|nr:hypothetical protein AVEN_138220-1 [Araneus ventricosus]GBN22737.1 hypothetical protein AVEN_20110-1 [Araneus ventricosus]
MAKASKKKSQNEPISVSEIYETIQARDFLRELWWDLISDIQEKPTYKRIKAMVSDVINNTTKTFTSKSVDGNEELKWRTALTEISIMTYTLDTVISEVLYRRYQNEFEDIVKNLIKDLLENKAKEASNPAKSDSVFENIEKIFDNENPRLMGKKGNDHTVSDTKKSAKNIEEVNDAPARKRGRPKKVNVDDEKAENVNTVPKRKRGRPSVTTQKSMTESFDDKVKIKENDDQESDAESDISIGNLSIDSVSSVHTSELSSFEDKISICSGDEGEKKHIPLKVANDMYLQGKLSQIYHFGKRSERFKLMHNACASNSKDLTKTNNSSSANVDSSSRKVLPQRIRKPNSKYSSETMYCDVKDYSSPPGDTGSSSSQEEMDNKSSRSPKIQRKRKRSSLDKGTASSSAIHNVPSTRNSSASKRVKTSTSPLSKSSTKRYDTSDLYKPRPVTGSTIGSRSTAITLFSS